MALLILSLLSLLACALSDWLSSHFGGHGYFLPRFSEACLQQLRQLRKIHRNPPRLVPGQQLSRRAPSRLILEIDICKLLAAVIAHDEAHRLFLDGPRRREAAGLGRPRTKGSIGRRAVFLLPRDIHLAGSYARRRLHRYWRFDRMYAFRGSDVSPATKFIIRATGSGVQTFLTNRKNC
jgi:hypothetical protein